MIPNFAPMAAVYHRISATGSRDGKLFSLPVAAWNTHDTAMVVLGGTCLEPADNRRSGVQFLGIWERGWTPSYDEMASLLPEHVPGTPHPLATPVTVREIPGGWAAFRENGSRITEAVTYGQLEMRLSVLGTFYPKSIVRIDDED